MDTEKREKLANEIGYLETAEGVKLQQLTDLLRKRHPSVSLEAVREAFPDLKIYDPSSFADDVTTGKLDTTNRRRLDIDLGEIVEEEALELTALSQDQLTKEQKHELVEQEAIVKAKIADWKNELYELEHGRDYYGGLRLINTIQNEYPEFPDLPTRKKRYQERVDNAEKCVLIAYRSAVKNHKVDYLLQALDFCRDCAEAIEALSHIPPDVPSSLSTVTYPHMVTLTWPSSVGDNGVTYRLLRKETNPPHNAQDGVLLQESAYCNYEDKALVAGKHYYYALYALRGSTYSQEAATAGPVFLLSELTSVMAEPRLEQVYLSWQPVDNALGLAIYRSFNIAPSSHIGGELLVELNGDATEYLDMDLATEITYGYLLCVKYRDPISGEVLLSQGTSCVAVPFGPTKKIDALTVQVAEGAAHLEWSYVAETTTIIAVSSSPVKYGEGEQVEKTELQEGYETYEIPIGVTEYSIPFTRLGEFYFACFSAKNGLISSGAKARLSYLPSPSNHVVTQNANGTVLEWDWPEFSEWMRVEYTDDGYAFERAQSEQMVSNTLHRKEYFVHQGVVLNDLESKPYFFRIYCLPDQSAQRSSWSAPLELTFDNSPPTEISYLVKVKRSLFGKIKQATLLLECEAYDKAPTLELYYSTNGSVPVDKRMGQFIMRISSFELSRSVVSLEIPEECLGENHYIKLFFEASGDNNCHLITPNKNDLKLF